LKAVLLYSPACYFSVTDIETGNSVKRACAEIKALDSKLNGKEGNKREREE
jgi:hypothetical protein